MLEIAAIPPSKVPHVPPELTMPPPNAPTALIAVSSIAPIFSRPTARIAWLQCILFLKRSIALSRISSEFMVSPVLNIQFKILAITINFSLPYSQCLKCTLGIFFASEFFPHFLFQSRKKPEIYIRGLKTFRVACGQVGD